MADYTHLNLKELDDAAAKFGLSPNLEFRAGRGPLETRDAGLSYLRLAPNFRMPFGHRHKQQEEVYVVVSGSARINVEGEVRELRQWDAVRLPPDTARGFEGGPEGAELLIVGTPNTGSGDTEVLQGWWG